MHHIAKQKRLGKMIDELKVGDKASLSKSVTEQEVYMYMGITNDMNPIYVDREFASRTPFKEPVVPGILVAGHIVAALTTRLPGPGTITVSQRFHFVSPARCGDTLTTELEIVEIKEKENRARIKTVTRNQNDAIVVVGESEVMPPPKLRSILSYAFEGYE